MKLGSLFDGSGGFPLAGAIHGITPVWASEIEPYPIRVTKARFPQMKHLGSVLDVNGAEAEPVDIITFGSPCQDLSVAGKQAGLHKGERSNLFFEAIRIIKEMREATDGTYPRIAVWENVPGAYSSNKGEDFRAVLEAFAQINDETADVPMPPKKWHKSGAIVGDGWSVAWRTLDAQFWGVPQRRRRIYLIADFGSERAGEILFEPESVRGNIAESGTAGKRTPGDAEGSVGRGVFNESGKGYWMPGYGCLRAEGENRPSRPGHIVCEGVDIIRESRGAFEAYEEDADKAGALKRSDYKGAQVVCFQACGDRNNPSISTSEKAYCIPANPMSDRGQAICFQQNQRDEVRSLGDKTGAIAANGGAHQTNYICSFMGGQGDRARSIAWTENATPPLKAVPSGSNAVPDVCYAVRTAQTNANGIGVAQDAHTLDGANAQAVCYQNKVGALCVDDYKGINQQYVSQDKVVVYAMGRPLDCMHDQQIALYTKQAIGHYCELKVASTQQARQYKSADDLIVSSAKPPRKYIIRRLTPLECLRLQGLPDGWLDGVDGSDSAKYKMLGNGIAMPNAIYVVGCAVQLLREGKHENEG